MRIMAGFGERRPGENLICASFLDPQLCAACLYPREKGVRTICHKGIGTVFGATAVF